MTDQPARPPEPGPTSPRAPRQKWRPFRQGWPRWVAGTVLRKVITWPGKLARTIGPERSVALGAWLMRSFGRFAPEHKIAEANLAAAMPELSPAERKAIVRGMWDNLGRLGGEFFHSEWVTAPESSGRRRITGVGREWLTALQETNRTAIIFSAHLANWEVMAQVSARVGVPATLLFRRPSTGPATRLLGAVRGEGDSPHMLVASGRGAIWKLAETFERGGLIGVMMDQRYSEGIEVPFFGRPSMTNPIVARLARTFDCPVHGIRVIRLPDSKFRVEVTPPLDLPRDARGRIDVVAGTTMINGIIEGWVREHPDQWLWAHDRWRMPKWRPKAEPAANSE